jgi:hypothetical protein
MLPVFRKIRKKLAADSQFAKYSRYAIGEIILVVIGILIALQINNWNEDRIQSNRIEKYAQAIIQDLESDIVMLKIIEFQALNTKSTIDSLCSYVREVKEEDYSNTDLYFLSRRTLYRPYSWNRATFQEIKNSGSIRYLKNKKIENMLVHYEAFSYHLDEDYASDENLESYAIQLVAQILNLNSTYIQEIEKYTDEMDFNTIMDNFDYFEAPVYLESKANDLPLISKDPALIQRMVNVYIQIRGRMETRGELEVPNIIKEAEEIIALLKKEFPQ